MGAAFALPVRELLRRYLQTGLVLPITPKLIAEIGVAFVATSNVLHSRHSDDRCTEANSPARSPHQISSACRLSVALFLAERR